MGKVSACACIACRAEGGNRHDDQPSQPRAHCLHTGAIVVTGASSGIGLDAATALASKGAYQRHVTVNKIN